MNFFLVILALIAGWGLGMVVNYLSDFLPVQRRLVHPFCLHCSAEIYWLDYLNLSRSCRSCQQKRSWRTWLVELVFIIGSAWMLVSPPSKLNFIAGMVLFAYFGLVFVIDVEHRLILHPVSLAGVAIGSVIGISLHGWQATLLGGIAGFGTMLLLYFLGFGVVRLVNRWRNQEIDEEALGFGDVNLGGVLGLILGWPGIIAGLVLAILLGGLVSLIYLVVMIFRREYHPNLAIPYGPFLVISAFLLLYFKNIFAKM